MVDNSSFTDANNAELMVANHSSCTFAMRNSAPRLWYPEGTDNAGIHNYVLWIGAKVWGEVRVTTGVFAQGYTPGPVLGGCGWPGATRLYIAS